MSLLHNLSKYARTVSQIPSKHLFLGFSLTTVGITLALMILSFMSQSNWNKYEAYSTAYSHNVSSSGEKPLEKHLEETVETLWNQKPIVLSGEGRDPFRSYLHSKKPAPPKKAIPKPKPKPKPVKKVTPPSFTIQGFLGGQKPVAIVQQGDKTELVRPGDTLWGTKVLSIERGKMVVLKEGKKFTLTP